MVYSADFETTTDKNDCRVWAYALCEIANPANFYYGIDINGMFSFLTTSEDHTLYFHNLKFDGEFIFQYLFRNGYEYSKKRKLENYEFSSLISDSGLFYSIKIKTNKNTITIFDSLKIIPFSVEKIAKSFKLPISKLEIDYNEKREVGHILTKEEIAYIRNDVEIVARALSSIFNEGLTKMTQGSNALQDYKKILGGKRFKYAYPTPDYDSDIRQSYRGGFTYLNPIFAMQDVGSGIVLDVNSLYPSVMYSKPMPYGEGVLFEGRYQHDKYYPLYVQFFVCQFELKPGHIPTIQMKHTGMFADNEYLTSSNGEDLPLCLTSVDLELFLEHYDIFNVDWVRGWKFKSTDTLFRDYIDKWSARKIQAKKEHNDGQYTLSKLMLNALYGKFATNPNVRSKHPYLDDDGVVRYKLGEAETRKALYIPMGTFITAWARFTTISAAQKVYDRFIYADTDSLHLTGTELPEGLEIDDTKLGAWKHESTFTRARFLRQKTYIEEINGELKVTCAGMPHEVHQHVTWDNFRIGAVFNPNELKTNVRLRPCHVDGGIVLENSEFTIRK